MGLFSQKSKITTEDFCSDFYGQFIFSPNIGGVDPWEAMCEASCKTITDIDPTFEQIDFSAYIYELRSIRLEVFATVWGHQVNEKLSLEHSKFTKHYLEEREAADIWESMENYNQAISRATDCGHNSGSRADRVYLTCLNKARMDLFDKGVELGYGPEVVARVGNRVRSDKAWKSGRGNVYLAFELGRQLDFDHEELNEEARLAVIYTIHGFYLGALEAMKKVKII